MKYFITAIILVFTLNINKKDYSLKLEVGETYSQKYTANSKVEQSIMGMEQVIEIAITSSIDFTVTKKMADRYGMDVSYASIEMIMKLPQGETKVSTEEESDDQMSKMMSAMIGKKFYVEMLTNGEVAKVENLENVFESMFESLPDLTEQEREQSLDQMMQSYGEKAFRGNIEMITAILPKEKVDIGDSWNSTTLLESGFPATVSNTFTLISADPSVVIIEGRSSINTEERDTPLDINGMKTSYELSGTVTGRYKLDAKTNWVIEGQVEQKMKGQAKIEDNPQIPGGITIPMEISNIMTIGQ